MATRIVRYKETLMMGLAVSLGHGLLAMIITSLFVGSPLNLPSLVAFTLGTALVFIAGLVNVPTGYRGVIKHFDEPQEDRLLHNGNHWIFPIPWVRSVELMHVKAIAIEGEALNQTLVFHVYDFVPIHVRVLRVRWRISNPKVQLEDFDPYKPEEVMQHVQDAVLVLGQQRSANLVDILTNVAETFTGLEEMVNEQLMRPPKGIPISVVDIGLPRPSIGDARFKEFLLRLKEINLWRAQEGLSGEAFLRSFYMDEEGRIKYSSHSVDVRGIIDHLRDYFKGR